MGNRSWQGWRALVAADTALLRRHRRFALAVLGALFVPALYALIYLSSLWDPSARTGALRAGLVNGDRGALHRNVEVNMGEQVRRALLRQHLFSWQVFDDAEAARLAVRRGELNFAVLIPADFSEQALPGREAGAAQLTIYTSEGNSYSAAGFAKRFAPELAHRVNESLNEQRWSLVLETAAGSRLDLATLRDRVVQLRDGSRQLAEGLQQADRGTRDLGRGLDQALDGTRQLQRGAAQLADGSSQLGTGWRPLATSLRTLDAQRPAAADLEALRQGSQRLVHGQDELGRGLETLAGGSRSLHQGALMLEQATAPIPLVGDDLAEAAGRLGQGADRLGQGLGQAREASRQLHAGQLQLAAGLQTLTGGVTQAGNTIHQIVGALPEDSRIDALAHGAQQLGGGTLALGEGLEKLRAGQTQLQHGLGELDDGGRRLHEALTLLARSLPADVALPEGSARGLADSVEPKIEVTAPVGSDGAGFAPNFVPMSLWIGAVTAALMFHLRRLPREAATLARPLQVLGKLAWPAAIVLGQAVVMVAMLTLLLKLQVLHIGAFIATVTAASLTFLAIMFLLIRWFGDFGKALGLLLLVIQMCSAGAAMPIELASPLFQAIHPWLPFTWVVKAFRASLFGAYDGQWLMHWSVVAGCGTAALLGAMLFGRWRVVDEEDYLPGIEFE
ncbi:MAG: putative rane protein [Pseudomonadota bacterium]|nr:putative rane protein [Pseudomonadota bacterium]